MPSMRMYPLNPRPPAVPGAAAEPGIAATESSKPEQAAAAASGASPAADDLRSDPRAGGFHESSYELQHGLQVSESEWPDDMAEPGAPGAR